MLALDDWHTEGRMQDTVPCANKLATGFGFCHTWINQTHPIIRDLSSTILSVKELVTKGCRVTFHSRGGHIRYPSRKTISFTIRDIVFFVPLNVLPPECENTFGQSLSPGRGFTRHGPQ